MSSYLTPPQIASELGVQPAKVLTWIRTGELKAINLAIAKNGRRPRWRISRQSLDDFLEARTSSPPQRRKRHSRRRGEYNSQYYGEGR